MNSFEAPNGVIVRRWTATALLQDKAEYPRHFMELVLPALRSTPGFLRAELLTRRKEALIEFTVLTSWESLQAIVDFAGEDATAAVVHPDAQQALAEYDRTVTLYERLVSTS